MKAWERNTEILKRAIHALPLHKPSDRVLIKLRYQLFSSHHEVNRSALTEAIAGMTEYTTSAALRRRYLRPTRKGLWFRIAASIAILAGISWVIIQYYPDANHTNITLNHSVETFHRDLAIFSTAKEDHTIQEFIKQSCKTVPVACAGPQYKSLEAELDEVKTAIEEIKSQMARYKTDTELMRILVKQEKSRTKIEKEILRLLIS